MSKADEKDIHCNHFNDNGEDEEMYSYDVIYRQFNLNGIMLKCQLVYCGFIL